MAESRAAEPWAAEIEVTAALAAAAIARGFPWLNVRSVEALGEGWDNAAFIVNGAWIFRFPRRAVAAAPIETESRILPLIAWRLPLPIPVPVFLGSATADYPWPYSGYAMLAGAPLSDVRSRERGEGALAKSLGTFLRALHGIDATPLVAAGLPADVIGRLDHDRMMPKFKERLRALRAAGLVRNDERLVEFLEAVAPAGPRRDGLATVHGDLYARHVLVDERLEPCGIIDWGDVHLGDPAVDLSIAFSMLSPPARDAFFGVYGKVDARTLELARYRAIYHSAMVAHYGLRIGDAQLVAVGTRGLDLG